MELIINNPYRIVGIPSNATEKELHKQKTKINAYSKVGKEIVSDYDFDILGKITRTENSINKAFADIQQNQDKVNHSLFWFSNEKSFDSKALEYLRNGDAEKAVEIWEELIRNGEVSSENFSAFNNIGTFKLLSQSKDDIKEGIAAKIKLIESDNFENFVYSVAGLALKIDSQKQLQKLIDELLTCFKNQLSSSETMELFGNCNDTTQKYLSRKLTEGPIHNIESQIESCKKNRKSSKSDAYEYGLKLFRDTVENLSFLKSLLGENDLNYKSIADLLANEIMQCGIDYFKEWKDTKDPCGEALELLGYAQSLAVGSQTKDRTKENIAGIKEWEEGYESRWVLKRIQPYVDNIKERLERIVNPDKNDYGSLTMRYTSISMRGFDSSGIFRVKSGLVYCEKELQLIYKELDSQNEKVLVQIEESILIGIFKTLISELNSIPKQLSIEDWVVLKMDIIKILTQLDILKAGEDCKTWYRENRNKIMSNFDIDEEQLIVDKPRDKDSKGCYIATMAYGDYDDPQVIILRKFRDNIISKTIIGKIFIRVYYEYSPAMVEKLKNKKTINFIIRKGLDQFIKIIYK